MELFEIRSARHVFAGNNVKYTAGTTSRGAVVKVLSGAQNLLQYLTNNIKNNCRYKIVYYKDN